jgi:hypothetical protein
MQTCWQCENFDYPIKLEQDDNELFRVTYGTQVRSGLTYAETAAALGQCLMHAMALNGDLNNSENDDPWRSIKMERYLIVLSNAGGELDRRLANTPEEARDMVADIAAEMNDFHGGDTIKVIDRFPDSD